MSQNIVYRYPLMRGVMMDTHALPCPRCRSANLEETSHPATGSMVTCMDCGARSNQRSWNDGAVDYERAKGARHYGGPFVPCPQYFKRPQSDVVKRVSRAYVQRMRKGKP